MYENVFYLLVWICIWGGLLGFGAYISENLPRFRRARRMAEYIETTRRC